MASGSGGFGSEPHFLSPFAILVAISNKSWNGAEWIGNLQHSLNSENVIPSPLVPWCVLVLQ